MPRRKAGWQPLLVLASWLSIDIDVQQQLAIEKAYIRMPASTCPLGSERFESHLSLSNHTITPQPLIHNDATLRPRLCARCAFDCQCRLQYRLASILAKVQQTVEQGLPRTFHRDGPMDVLGRRCRGQAQPFRQPSSVESRQSHWNCGASSSWRWDTALLEDIYLLIYAHSFPCT
jgi:hypothetical protein